MSGLTTTCSPFIEQAQSSGQLYIHQPYHLYSDENHATWRSLYARMLPLWDRYANPEFQAGLDALALDPGRIPHLDAVNRFLCPLTGFRAKAVSGYVPAFLFFDRLREREFPTTITIRPADSLGYLPEPDIFHDIAGHVPMHTRRAFAETLVRFGDCAHTAAARVAGIADAHDRVERLGSIYRALARFFWFTIEFGLMRHGIALKAYGSGLLSSHAELRYALEADEVQRSPVALEWIIHQSFEIHHFQPLLFVVESFDHLYSLVGDLESWMKQGRLDHVAPGEPRMSERDIESFLLAATA